MFNQAKNILELIEKTCYLEIVFLKELQENRNIELSKNWAWI